MRRRVLLAIAIALLASGCAKKKHKAAAPPLPPSAASMPRIGDEETGTASWYGHPYHGRRASNGEIYDMEKLTAAHRTLPFGVLVRVQNLTNDLTTDVRITDRGPFVDGRIIDLSRAAAREIKMLGPGTAKVRVRVIALPPRPRKATSPCRPAPSRTATTPSASAKRWRTVSAPRASRIARGIRRSGGCSSVTKRPPPMPNPSPRASNPAALMHLS